MKMIQISESKKTKLADCTEKVLHYAGKLMQCVESLEEGDYGERYGYGHRMGMREWDDDEPDMDYGHRRGVAGTGPYSRYRY